MTKIRVPSFLTGLDKSHKVDMIKEYQQWREWEVAELLREHLALELDRLIQEDEKHNFSSWFETRWTKAKRLGKRDAIRQLLKDLN